MDNKKQSDIESKIVSGYTNGLSMAKIGEKYNIPRHKVSKILQDYNVKRNYISIRKYTLDENYFETIDTPNKAYILGLLFADGSNNPSKMTVSISLQEEDVQLLEKIRSELKSTKPLEYLNYSNKHDFGYSYKNQYRLLFFSSHLCKSLSEIGMIKNKSLTLEFPEIDRSLYSHFIRGYFDGDGSFCHRMSKHGLRDLITFTSTENFCKSLQKILISEIKIPGGNVYDASCHNGITKVLSLSGRLQTKSILDWMYHDADLYLERKYQKYINAFYADENSNNLNCISAAI